jgi:hypothetical protein
VRPGHGRKTPRCSVPDVNGDGGLPVADRPATTGLIALTCDEIRRLLTVLVVEPARALACPKGVVGLGTPGNARSALAPRNLHGHRG